MPRPVFNIEEYELRGVVPEVYTKDQEERLNKTLSRVQGQIDWTAQLLGFNGPNYWGEPNTKADFSYNWEGLPQTMNEKRQMQVGAYGVYNKNLDYEEWPSPFNRSQIKASGDARIHIFERGNFTFLSPLGQGEEIDFSRDPVFFVGSSYVFDSKVEFTVSGGEAVDQVIAIDFFYEADQVWTRAKILEPVEFVTVRKYDSEFTVTQVNVIQWEDITDWTPEAVRDQFIGLWGNKGNTLSMDFAFDALDLHGFDERWSLSFPGTTDLCISIERMLGLVGLETTEYTKFYNELFVISIGEDCPDATPVPPFDPFENIDNGDMDAVVPPDSLLDNGVEGAIPAPTPPAKDSGFYERVRDESGYIPDNTEFYRCEEDCSYRIAITQTLSEPEECPEDPCPNEPQYYSGIGELCFDYTPISACAKIELPCIEWVFDPSLDDGEYERDFSITDGPWATANEGEYDRVLPCGDSVIQGTVGCEGPAVCGFDDGEYDEIIGQDDDGNPLNCDSDNDDEEACEEADGGFYTLAGPPDYDDCDCALECCLIDNGLYLGANGAYTGPDVINGGTVDEACVLYSNGIYELTVQADCLLDDGDFDDPIPAATLADEGDYDRTLQGCVACDENAPDGGNVVHCEVDNYRVQLNEVLFGDLGYLMDPNIRNSLTPLRVWKNHVLTVTDTVPQENTEYYNYLVADENRGPEPEDAYRYFVRLPLEYTRNGKEWNRAVAVCNNQGYFSAPPSLSDTEADPPVIRPPLYSENYWRDDLPDYTVFYEEDYIVSEVRIDNEEIQPFFKDSKFDFEPDQPIPYDFAQVTNYDPFFLRVPEPNGDWKGGYVVYGPDNTINRVARTGHVSTDLENGAILDRVPALAPVYDQSAIINPNLEFPDSTDEASLKNYVVSYAYFVTDFSAADDPVFDPRTLHCWRSPGIECSEDTNDDGVCDTVCKTTNTAYRLHEYTLTC